MLVNVIICVMFAISVNVEIHANVSPHFFKFVVSFFFLRRDAISVECFRMMEFCFLDSNIQWPISLWIKHVNTSHSDPLSYYFGNNKIIIK